MVEVLDDRDSLCAAVAVAVAAEPAGEALVVVEAVEVFANAGEVDAEGAVFDAAGGGDRVEEDRGGVVAVPPPGAVGYGTVGGLVGVEDAGAFPVAFVALWALIGWRLSRWAKGR